ncbi:MAG: RHS repeat-associated core domain-containing protein [Verrucomicrobiota bacterium]|nr:RHS repeat-associated core domain-containing protein [Verrucomicrobiota bacterium]
MPTTTHADQLLDNIVNRPQFSGMPQPVKYHKISTPEVPSLSIIDCAAPAFYKWTTIDRSWKDGQGTDLYMDTDTDGNHAPEFRRHHLLDQLVKDLKGDPIALAAYVQNEIELVDGVREDLVWWTGYGTKPDLHKPTPEEINDINSDYYFNIEIDDFIQPNQSFPEWILPGNKTWGISKIVKPKPQIKRNALSVYLQKEGSPAEQCILLVYLLRRAGYAAGIAEPGSADGDDWSGSMRIEKDRFNRLIHQNIADKISNENYIELLYPWVVFWPDSKGTAPINEDPVFIYPWLKDTVIDEGFDLYSVLPTNRGESITGKSWLENYLNNNTSFDTFHHAAMEYAQTNTDDSPGAVFPKYIKRCLESKSLSIDDIGLKIYNRKHNYVKWGDFPVPLRESYYYTVINDYMLKPYRYMKFNVKLNRTSYAYGQSPDDNFWYEKRELDSSNTEKGIETNYAFGNNGDSRYLMDFFNRKFYVVIEGGSDSASERYYTNDDLNGSKVMKNLKIMFYLAPFDNERSDHSTGSFEESNMYWAQQISFDINNISDSNSKYRIEIPRSEDNTANPQYDNIGVDRFYHFQLQLDTAYQFDILGNSYLENTEVITSSYNLKVGTLGAITISYGKVTDQMLRVHAEEFWKHQIDKERGLITENAYDYSHISAISYLMGMSYYKNIYDSNRMIENLHKINIPVISLGTSIIEAPEYWLKTTNRLTVPILNMKTHMLSSRNYSVTNPDTYKSDVVKDAFYISTGNLSAYEHVTINKLFNMTDSISAVKLIQKGNLADNSHMLQCTPIDYTDKTNDDELKEQILDTFTQTTRAQIDNTSVWDKNDFSVMYVTPVPVATPVPVNTTPTKSTFNGYGLLLVRPYALAGIISNTQSYNGGYSGYSLSAFTESNYSLNSTSSFWNSSNLRLENTNNTYLLTPITYVNNTITSSALFNNISFTNNAWNYTQVFDSFNSYNIAETNTTSYIDPFQRSSITSTLSLLGNTSPISSWGSAFGTAFQAGNIGTITSSYDNISSSTNFVSDPVNIITGEFYEDTVDLSLEGPIHLDIRRNYSSQSDAMGAMGYGWKLAYTPSLTVTTDKSIIYAAHPDGSVVAYSKVNNENTWIPTIANNPTLTNFSGSEAPGKSQNPFLCKIVKTSSDPVTYSLYYPNGHIATYVTKTFNYSYHQNSTTGAYEGLKIVRPYLVSYEDQLGNSLTFTYEETRETPADPNSYGKNHEFGQLKRIDSSNGNFVVFNYNTNGTIEEAFTNDGRSVSYSYSGDDDLILVTLPDGSQINYEYLKKNETNKPEYSTHLLTKITRPDGRVLENIYDPNYNPISTSTTTDADLVHRRVVQQNGTVGDTLALVPLVKYKYESTPDVPLSMKWPNSAGTDYNVVRVIDVTRTGGSEQDANVTTYVLEPASGSMTGSGKRIVAIADPLVTKNLPLANGVEVFDKNTAGLIVYDWYADGTLVQGEYQRSLKSQKDKRGLVTNFTYDVSGNVKSQSIMGELDGDPATTDDSRETKYFYDPISIGSRTVQTLRKIIYASSGVAQKVQYIEFPGNMNDTLRQVEGDFEKYAFLPKYVYDYYSINPSEDAVIDSAGALQALKKVERFYTSKSEGGKSAYGLLKQVKITGMELTSGGETVEVLHNDSSFEYDVRGFVTKQTSKVLRDANGSSTDTVSMTNTYNSRGFLMEQVDPAKRTTRFQYDMMGRKIAQESYASDITSSPLATNYTYYNLNGEVSWEDGPQSGPEDYVFKDYDGDGRVITEIKWRSKANASKTGVEATATYTANTPSIFFNEQTIIRFDYDAFGNLKKMTDGEGNEVVYESNAIGLKTKATKVNTDAGGVNSVETWTYERGGQIETYTNPLNGTTTYLYTTDGQPRKITHPDGTMERWLYHADGRKKRYYEVYVENSDQTPNDTLSVFWDYTYLDSSRNSVRTRKSGAQTLAFISEIEDACGRIVLHLEKASASESYSTTTSYDGLGRVIVQSGPVDKIVGGVVVSRKQTVTYAYGWNDQTNTLTETVTTGTGDEQRITVTTRDALDRVILVQVKDNTGTVLETVSSSFDIAHNYTITTTGEGSSQVSTKTYTDTFGKEVLRLSQADDGQYTKAVVNTYDRNGNLLTMTDENNVVTTYEYNSLNLLSKSTMPGTVSTPGASTTYGYDTAGNIITRTMPKSLVWSAQYTNAGKLDHEALIGGSQAGRYFKYDYYTGGRERGMLQTVTEKQSSGTSAIRTNTFYYNTSLLLDHKDSVATGTDISVRLTYTYDWRGLSKSVTREDIPGSSGYPNYPKTTNTFSYDGYGQVYDDKVEYYPVSGGGYGAVQVHSHLTEKWNALGQRTQLAMGANASRKGFIGSTPSFTYAYHPNGTLKSVSDHLDHSTEYLYGTNGLLTTSTLKASGTILKESVINDRDKRGRIRGRDMQLLGVANALTEDFTWKDNSKIESYTSNRSGTWNSNGWGALSETRNYTYNERQQLDTESYKKAAADANTTSLAFGYDTDANGKVQLGVLVSAKIAGTNYWNANSATPLDAMGRVASDVETTVYPAQREILAQGSCLGAKTLKLELYQGAQLQAGYPKSISVNDDNNGLWAAPILVNKDQNYSLQATLETTNYPGTPTSFPSSTSTFTIGGDITRERTATYNDLGFLQTRTWSGLPGNPGTITQSFTWDATGKLTRVSQTDSRPTKGEQYTWTAIYDGLGRRLVTTYTPLNANGTANGRPIETRSWYDPEVEFLEIAVETGKDRYWKLCGLDLGEAYGGKQGVGGIEGILSEGTQRFTPLITNLQGHVIGYMEESGGNYSVTWNGIQSGGYGVLPGSEVHALEELGTLEKSIAWQSRRIDPTGLYYFGTRYYDPSAGRFISPDPAGHSGSMDLYSYADGDPINRIDPDGRFGRETFEVQMPQYAYQESSSMVQRFGDLGFDLYDGFMNTFVDNDWDNPNARSERNEWYYSDIRPNLPSDLAVFQMGLDVAGPMIGSMLGGPVGGAIGGYFSGSINTAIYAANGDYVNAGFSAASTIASGLSLARISVGSSFGGLASEARATRSMGAAAETALGTRGASSSQTFTYNITAKSAASLSDLQFLQRVATKTESTGVRLGKGATGTGTAQGIWKHNYAKNVVERYQRMTGQKTHLQLEKSWVSGSPVSYGTKGSARPDVFDPLTGTIYDYKFVRNPGYGLSAAQRAKNLTNVPNVTIQLEINP